MTAPTSWDYDALWIKAKLFINRALDGEESRSFDERALWAALSLELLGKAALSRVSPLLIAEPNEEGANLLAASGLIEGEPIFLSVRAATIFKRCARAFRPFNTKEAQNITNARNEYLHGGGIAFVKIPEDVWWSKFWGHATILVTAQDKDLHDFVGDDRVGAVEAHLSRNKENIKQRSETLLFRAKQRVVQRQSGEMPTRVAEEWSRHSDQSIYASYRVESTCPACGEQGILEGDEVGSREYHVEQLSEEDFFSTVELTVLADWFSCENCRLVLDRPELLEEAGVEPQFTVDGGEGEYPEPDYGND